MAFWKVAGFTQPSPIEVINSAQVMEACDADQYLSVQHLMPVCVLPLQQILDKEEFTLEELLDEDDIIQECKSLNGRLITL